MLRAVGAALRGVATRVASTNGTNSVLSNCNPVLNCARYRGYGALSSIVQNWAAIGPTQQKTLLLSHAPTENYPALSAAQLIKIPVRTVIKFSLRKGKRKTVKAVPDRFYRLAWGIWIRTKSGRGKKLWRKSSARKKRLREHVFCNAKQCTLLDKMVTSYWRRRHYYVEDPYNPYHEREEFALTRKKPLP